MTDEPKITIDLEPRYAHGYGDNGTYEPIPFVGEFWGDEFMPAHNSRLETDASGREARYIATARWQRENKERYNEYQRQYYRRKKK